MKVYKGWLTKENMPENGIFIFGSNTEGRHGAGNARAARMEFGAKYGQAEGLQGKAYGIVTKDLTKDIHPSVSSSYVKKQIKELYKYAKEHPENDFFVAYSTKGPLLSGFSIEQLVNFFCCITIPDNIIFEESFGKLIKEKL